MTTTPSHEADIEVPNATRIHTVLEDATSGLAPGRSSVVFAPGRGALRNTSSLKTVVVVLLDVDEGTQRTTYEYLHNLQVVTQRLRPLIVTDGHDLRQIRKYGWLTEHVFTRTVFDALGSDESWVQMALRRVLGTVKHFDAASTVIVQSPGVTEGQHSGLMQQVKLDIPYAAVTPASLMTRW